MYRDDINPPTPPSGGGGGRDNNRIWGTDNEAVERALEEHERFREGLKKLEEASVMSGKEFLNKVGGSTSSKSRDSSSGVIMVEIVGEGDVL